MIYKKFASTAEKVRNGLHYSKKQYKFSITEPMWRWEIPTDWKCEQHIKWRMLRFSQKRL